MTLEEAWYYIERYKYKVQRLKFRAAIKEAAQTVASWPAWKRDSFALKPPSKSPQKQGKK